MKQGDYYQTGDVLYKYVETKPKKATVLKGGVLVQDSHSGNPHSIEGGDYRILKTKDKLYLDVKKEVQATHPEHNTINIPKGCYEIGRVMEFDHFLEESREVID